MSSLFGFKSTFCPAAVRVLLCLFALILLVGAPSASAQNFSGSIFTTFAGGTVVNGNIYPDKSSVYLNGGPQNTNSKGLPIGTYYFQVTDPNGNVLLSTDDITCRQVVVGIGTGGQGVFQGHPAGGPLAACTASDGGLGNFHANGSVNAANGGSIPVQLCAQSGCPAGSPDFLDTPNQGGEYKVWLTNVSDYDPVNCPNHGFCAGKSKTDNFKVQASQCTSNCPSQHFTISGTKFYDANLDGIQDNGEAGIQFWQIRIGSSNVSAFVPFGTTTDHNGAYSFPDLAAGTYGVCEVIPAGSPTWVATTPTSIFPITVGPDSPNNNFGNVCLGAGGGLTLGFWSNKNGQGLITASNLCLLDSLNLRYADGSNFDPVAGCPSPTSTQTSAGKTNLRNWLLNATATNMSYMLSAQLTAMELNVAHGFVSGNANVFAGTAPAGCSVPGLSSFGFISINNLMNDANIELGADGSAVAGDPDRPCQEFKKNALDAANNNQNFVQATACAVNYTGTETCSPTP